MNATVGRVLALGAALALAAGCDSRIGVMQYGVRDQSPRLAEEDQSWTPGGFDPSLLPGDGEMAATGSREEAPIIAADGERPGNPAEWGEAARIAAGRRFDPVRFGKDDDELDLNAQRQLQQIAAWLRENPRVWAVSAGFCDLDSTPEFAYAIGMARARAVQEFLDLQGVPSWRIFPISYGQSLPVAEGVTPDANALNNRVELWTFLQPPDIPAPKPVRETDPAAPDSFAPPAPPPAVELSPLEGNP